MRGIVYKVENIINGRVYIGQTTQSALKRKRQHFNELKNGKHGNELLQKDYNKYGKNSFKFKTISRFYSKNKLNEFEIYFIEKNKENCYNIREGGINGKLAYETKKKISQAHLGKKHSKASILKMREAKLGKNNPMYGIPLSIENRERLRKINQGKKLSKETRQKISAANKGENHPFYKGKLSLEHRKNMSISKRGRYPGAYFMKNKNPEIKCWHSRIQYNHKNTSLGYYNDPISAMIVYNLVWNEIYKK